MSNENQPKIKELENREKELLEKIEQLRKAGEELSDKKMQKIGEIIEETENDNKKSKIDLEKEGEYLDFIKNSDGDFNTEKSNNTQNKELNKMRRKIQRDFANQETKIGISDGGIDEYEEEESNVEKSPFINYEKEYKNREEYEADKKRKLSQKVSDLLDPLFLKNGESTKRREANGNHFINGNNSESKEKIEEKKGKDIEIENTLDLTGEEEKILSEAEAQIEEENKIISEAEKKIAELKSRLKVVEFKKKKEEQEKSKEKAKNKKVAKKQVGGKTIDD